MDDLEREGDPKDDVPLRNCVFGEPQGRYRARVRAALETQGIFERDTILPPQSPIGREKRQELREILQDLDEL